MDTVRVNICYRPLRICWAIAAGDIASFRKAVKLSNTMWGGRFNPIAIVDRAEEAERIVEVFRADMILPIGASETVKGFLQRFPHLMTPFFHDDLFVGTPQNDRRAQVLDIHNTLMELSDTPAWTAIKSQGLRLYGWDENDPLTDVFLMHLGAYPDVAETGIDYRAMVKQVAEAKEQQIDQSVAVSVDVLEHPSVAYLSRHGLHRHYGIRTNWDYAGFYLGDATNLDDLTCCWNLRAADTALFFVDRNHLARYQHIIPAWARITKETLSHRQFEHLRNLAVWQRRETTPVDHNAHVAMRTRDLHRN